MQVGKCARFLIGESATSKLPVCDLDAFKHSFDIGDGHIVFPVDYRNQNVPQIDYGNQTGRVNPDGGGTGRAARLRSRSRAGAAVVPEWHGRCYARACGLVMQYIPHRGKGGGERSERGKWLTEKGNRLLREVAKACNHGLLGLTWECREDSGMGAA